ncbi:hypothetical protein KUTeg_012182 [Tegillarca granosa]|uniref:Phorbol-ester/DAG-type domain-containing protein n=1 Tax=Tegillarca granosa TaxID=220873 RepID=A0ABQ9F350_TEGGR|nr:hypothetical protein KUTeg_012182 [Tegillarca granosa]
MNCVVKCNMEKLKSDNYFLRKIYNTDKCSFSTDATEYGKAVESVALNSSPLYVQIQTQLYSTKCDWRDFVFFTRKGMLVSLANYQLYTCYKKNSYKFCELCLNQLHIICAPQNVSDHDYAMTPSSAKKQKTTNSDNQNEQSVLGEADILKQKILTEEF